MARNLSSRKATYKPRSFDFDPDQQVRLSTFWNLDRNYTQVELMEVWALLFPYVLIGSNQLPVLYLENYLCFASRSCSDLS